MGESIQSYLRHGMHDMSFALPQQPDNTTLYKLNEIDNGLTVCSNMIVEVEPQEPFTKEEDNIILNKVNTIGKRWRTIVNFVPGRSPKDIEDRYRNYISKHLRIT